MSKLQARNEAVIHAPVSKIWAIITNIDVLPEVNPGVLEASGSMNQLNGIRTCVMDNKGKTGTMTEKLIEFIPEKKTVWTIESDTMGMSKMLRDTKFCFYLEKIDDTQTKIINESYYTPSNFIVSIMNVLMMKRMMSKIQGQILSNVKRLSESN
ncbi:MAG: SRPBCC family protein [Bacteroidia bacterium]